MYKFELEELKHRKSVLDSKSIFRSFRYENFGFFWQITYRNFFRLLIFVKTIWNVKNIPEKIWNVLFLLIL